MKERLAEFPNIEQRAFIGTLHSFCMEVLANRGKSVGIDKLPNIFESHQDRMQVLLQAVMDDPDLRHELKRVRDAREQEMLLSRWLEMIEEAKNNLLLPEMLDNETERKVYEAYNGALRASDVVDFDDPLATYIPLISRAPQNCRLLPPSISLHLY